MNANASNPSADFESYTYDANDNRLSLTKRDRTHTIGFTYDALNRETERDLPGGTADDVYTSYDLLNRKTSVLFASTSGSGIAYTYDLASRLLTETSYGKTLSYTYDPDSNRDSIAFPGTSALTAT